MDTGSTILITGGTGLLGKALAQALIERGHYVIILSRNKHSSLASPSNEKLSYANWDIKKQVIDINAVKKADYIFHLAGASVAEKRWTQKRKKEIEESRTLSSALLVKSLKENDNKVKAVISASAIGWYGADPSIPNEHPFTENTPADEHFLGHTCKLWEQSIEPVSFMNKRLVKFRIGIVLSNDGGAMKEFKKPLWFGIATILGSGKQVVSWIHIDDLIRIFLYSLENDAMQGVYNAVAPFPVSNKNLVLELAKQQKGKYFIPVHIPSIVIKILFGELSIEVLKSATVSSEKIQKTGFIFQYTSIEEAIRQLADS